MSNLTRTTFFLLLLLYLLCISVQIYIYISIYIYIFFLLLLFFPQFIILIILIKKADGVIKEKQIMEKMNHPFVMGLVNAQQDTPCLYMMMDLIQGGELRDRMRNDQSGTCMNDQPHLSEHASKFYAACLVEGLSYMHRRDYVYRDLKGENVMIDKEGYCVIIDLGFAKYVPDKTFTFCGTPIFIVSCFIF